MTKFSQNFKMNEKFANWITKALIGEYKFNVIEGVVRVNLLAPLYSNI